MQIQRIQQISESHCGTAVLAMLLGQFHISASQHELAALAEAEKTIEEDGTTPAQLGLATAKIAPHLQFWYKQYASIEDIECVLSKDLAVAVEWQSLFYDSPDQEPPEREGDFGHYSIITYIDRELDNIVVVDPYKDFPNPRFFSINFFLKRWYDINDVIDPISHKRREQKDTRMMFFITTLDKNIDSTKGFQRFTRSNSSFSER